MNDTPSTPRFGEENKREQENTQSSERRFDSFEDRPRRVFEQPRGERSHDSPRERRESRDHGHSRSDFNREPRGDSGRDRFKDKPREESPLASLFSLDKELVRLIVKRAALLKKVKNARPIAPHSQEIVQEPVGSVFSSEEKPENRVKPVFKKAFSPMPPAVLEKKLREGWESEVGRVSNDILFSRQLFNILQELSVLSRPVKGEITEEGTTNFEGFVLAPTRAPMAVDLPGVTSMNQSILWITLACLSGQGCAIKGLPYSDTLTDCMKVLNQAGASVVRESDETLVVRAGAQLDFTDAALYVGNSLQMLCILIALAASTQSKVKFLGGSTLNMANLSILRHFLPTLGARLAPASPTGQGLPARLETSGILPDVITITADLPQEMVVALLLTAPFWKTPVQIDLFNHPQSARICSTIMPVLQQCAVSFTIEDALVAYSGKSPITLPHKVPVGLDALVNAYFLALPMFNGGTVSLHGVWNNKHNAIQHTEALLKELGLEITNDGKHVETSVLQALPSEFNAQNLPTEMLPLVMAMACFKAVKKQTQVQVYYPDGADLEQLDAFAKQALCQTTVDRDNCLLIEVMPKPEPGDDETQGEGAEAQTRAPYTSTSAWWAMGLALVAFARPALLLANPGCVTEVMPTFWSMYNNLPNPAPAKPKIEEVVDAQPTKRRIIARD